jgi:drug/metabolite transporter (DMT)-like permease
MNPSLGIFWALISALTWGTADFAGGFAARRGHAFQILGVAAAAGIVLLIVLAWASGESLPPRRDLWWAGAAGISGSVGIAALYRGLATGSTAIVAPTAGVVTAVIPVVFNIATDGWPSALQLAGFVLAALGIWLVASGADAGTSRTAGLAAALIAGVGFGFFLILIAQVDEALVFAPLAVGRCATLLTALVLMVAARQGPPPMAAYPLASLAGILDAGGNVFYLMARQHVRLDVAAVLSSFYPVATVALSRLVLHERVSPSQWAGAIACLAAVGLITR